MTTLSNLPNGSTLPKYVIQPNVATHNSQPCRACHTRGFCLMSGLHDRELENSARLVSRDRSIERGERLFMAGDPIKSIFILRSGALKSQINSLDGQSQITDFYLPGDIAGMYGIEGHVHTDSVEALQTSSICEIHFDHFEDLMTTGSSLKENFMLCIFRQMNHEQKMLLVLGKMSSDRRVAHFLLDLSSRMVKRKLSATKINLSMTRADIGNYLGLAIETVSRVLTRFRQLGIIQIERGSICILDMDALKLIFEKTTELPATKPRSLSIQPDY